MAEARSAHCPQSNSIAFSRQVPPLQQTDMPKLVDVVQLTPRRSFDVPRAFDQKSQLRFLCTDLAVPTRWLAKALLPARVTAERYVADIQHGCVHTNLSTGLKFRYQCRRFPPNRKYLAQLAAADSLAAYYLRRCNASPTKSDAVYCLDCAASRVFESCGQKLKILEQCVAPRVSQQRALRMYGSPREQADWKQHFTALAEIERQEWRMADIILAPSEFVRSELLAADVPPEKVRLLPYWTPFSPLKHVPSRPSSPLRILFVGNDARRKGLPDVFDIAAALPDSLGVSIEVAGNVGKEFDQLSHTTPSKRIRYIGQIPHRELLERMRSAHIFLLPTYLEGSSVATYEALANGMALVTTPQAGSIVEHGDSGLLLQPGDIRGFSKAIQHLAESPETRERLSARGLATVAKFQFQQYAESLQALLN